MLTLYDGLKRLPRAQSRGFTPPHGWKDDAAGRGPSDIFFFPKGIVENYSDFRGADLLVMPTANYEMNILADFFRRSEAAAWHNANPRLASHGTDAIPFGNDVD